MEVVQREGTVRVRRVPKRELLKARSFDEYGRKKPSFSKKQVNHRLNTNLDSFVQQQNHSVSFCNTLLVVEATNSTTLLIRYLCEPEGNSVCRWIPLLGR